VFCRLNAVVKTPIRLMSAGNFELAASRLVY
jgi:hypothetical protein